VYRSDEHGFHNPPGLWASTRADILALGDSFVQGGCVPSDKNLIAHLRRRYPATLNTGLAGHGPLSMLGLLKETLPITKPRIVLWFYFEESDPIDLFNEQKSPLLLRYLEKGFSQNLLARQSAVDAALREYVDKELVKELSQQQSVSFDEVVSESKAKLASMIKLSTLRRRLGLVRSRQQETPEPRGASENASQVQMSEKDLSLFGRIISQAKDLVTESEGQLYFVYLPAWERYGYLPNARKDRDQVLSMIKSLAIPLIDVHLAFESQRDPLALFPFRRFGHYNEQGHRLVAETVLQHLSGGGTVTGSQPGSRFESRVPVAGINETASVQ
jgi:hypothetical protein